MEQVLCKIWADIFMKMFSDASYLEKYNLIQSLFEDKQTIENSLSFKELIDCIWFIDLIKLIFHWSISYIIHFINNITFLDIWIIIWIIIFIYFIFKFIKKKKITN